ncbi:MAG: selenocysteine-specific translation elongation factor [Alphaproteobacteria bacterium]
MSRTRTVVVIGHVDHGKTALVRALTGMETDRLPDEKERGLSIALGFAHCAYAGGVLDLIDAPGHEDFIRTMVAGAAGAEAALVVVSAADGIATQTREHLRIAADLGVVSGVLAFTKSDLLPPERRDGFEATCLAQIRALGFTPNRALFCSARTGEGLEALHGALEMVVSRTPDRVGPPGIFLPIDRVFSPSGAGTVVTGTLLGADVTAQTPLVLGRTGAAMPIRRLQVHGREVARARPGERVAVNLRGIAADTLGRGDVLHGAEAFAASSRLLVRLRLSDEGDRALRHTEHVRLMLGTASVVADVRLLEIRRLGPGEAAFAELRVAEPVVAFAGQRAVLRRLSPPCTLGGAVVLDPLPAPVRRRDPALGAMLQAAERQDRAGLIEALAARGRGIFKRADFVRLNRWPSPMTDGQELDRLLADLGGGQCATQGAVETLRIRLEEALSAFHAAQPLRVGAPVAALRTTVDAGIDPRLVDHVLRVMVRGDRIRMRRGMAALAGHDPLARLSNDQSAALEILEGTLREGGVEPPEPALLMTLVSEAEALLELLIETGRALSLYNHALRRYVVFHADSLDAAVRVLVQAFPPPATFTTGAARSALDTSRKFIVPMLEHFDTVGITHRIGDERAMVARLPDALHGVP